MNIPARVILDMAGTTVEDRGQVPAAFAAALAANGITITADEITRVRGASKRQAIRNLLPAGRGEDADRVYADFRRVLATTYQQGGVRALPGAEEKIRALRARGIQVALTTGFDRDIATLLLLSIGWTRNIVDAIVCGDDVASGRPAPDMILRAMALTAVTDASQVANLGDTALDLESAMRAGVRWNIGVLSGAHAREALERAPHTEIISSVADLAF